jgi:peptidyl-prolyl cis-trans isomerase NIMA-interacting 1
MKRSSLAPAPVLFAASFVLAACAGATVAPESDAPATTTGEDAPGEYPESQPSSAPTAAPKVSTAEAEAACIKTARTPWDTPGDPSAKASARHLLVAFAGSKRARPEISRTEGQACLRAMEARDKVRAGADFAEIAAAYSDEPGAASRGGSLGEFSRSMMVKPFGDAVFALEPGQVSDVVQTDFGFHVILREP